MSGRHLDRAFRHRFSYAYAPSTVDLDEAFELASNTSTETETEVADATRVALGTLSERQVRVLLERPGSSLEDLAAKLEVSRGTVDNEYRRALIKIREAAPNDDMFDLVLENIVRVASEGMNG